MDDISTPKTIGVRNVYIALYFVAAVLSGAGGNFLWLNNSGADIVAPDRFTGTQAAALTVRINRNEMDLDGHVRDHPDLENRYDTRIAVLESQIAALLLNQQRMLDKLDKLDK
jgi:hypothetical protein